MNELLRRLGVELPVIAAPMAGGPSAPDLIVAASRAGGFGFLAGGYKSASDLGAQIAAVRDRRATFGVNLFAPNPVPVDSRRYRDYATLLQPEATRLGVQLPAEPIEDDDAWESKIDLLLADPAPVASFTFGIPARTTIAALRKAGTLVVQTVTSPGEAQAAVEAGADALVVQASAAGGHSGTLTPDRLPPDVAIEDLLRSIRAVVDRPLIAAGGLSGALAVKSALAAGASAAMVGTALLLSDESAASAPYRAALAGGERRATVVTRAFTGRPARALPNRFLSRFGAAAPAGYPAIHHLTSPMRRAATAADDPEGINVWAGTGYRDAKAGSAAAILASLAAEA